MCWHLLTSQDYLTPACAVQVDCSRHATPPIERDLASIIWKTDPAALEGNEWWEEKLRVVIPQKKRTRRSRITIVVEPPGATWYETE